MGFLSDLMGKVTGAAASQAGGLVDTLADKATAAAKEAADTAIDKTAAATGLGGIATTFADKAKDMAGDAIEGAVDKAKDAVDGPKQA